MGSDTVQELEDERERRFWGMFLRVIWTSLIFLFVLGVLSSLTVLLGWQKYLLLCFVGLLAGIALSVAVVGSARSRDVTSLILGAITLPVLAAYLGAMAVRSEAAFSAYSASLFPFLVHATGSMLGGLWIRQVWQSRPNRPQPGEQGDAGRKHAQGALP